MNICDIKVGFTYRGKKDPDTCKVTKIYNNKVYFIHKFLDNEPYQTSDNLETFAKWAETVVSG